jgi:hypothetical protein
MPKLKAVLETLEGLDAALHALYAKEGDQFVLQIEGVNSHPTVAGLVSANGRITAERNALKAGAKAWKELVELRGGDEDLTPASLHEALEAKAGGTPKDVAEQLKEAERRGAERAETRAAKELEKVTKELGTVRSALQGRTVDGDLDAAIAKAGVVEKYRPAVRALLKLKNPEMIEEDGKFRGVFRTDPDGIPRDLSIDDFVSAFVKSDEASPYMPAGGGGSGGKDSGGPGGGGRPGTIDGNDPMAWGQNADKIAKGELAVSH